MKKCSEKIEQYQSECSILKVQETTLKDRVRNVYADSDNLILYIRIPYFRLSNFFLQTILWCTSNVFIFPIAKIFEKTSGKY